MEIKEQTRTLSDHPGLQVLLPYYGSYARKGMEAFRSEKRRFKASTVEEYAAGVFARVTELDNALGALRLTAGFVTELGTQSSPGPDIYRYHYENFVLRVIGIVDRAHRLVGAALLLDRKKFEGTTGNQYVQQQIKSDAELSMALRGVVQAVKSYKGPRNELIHAAAFNTPELGLFLTVHQVGLDVGDIDVDGLAREHFAQGGKEIAMTIVQLETLLATLLDVLAPQFSTAAAHEDRAPRNASNETSSDVDDPRT
jgi:hypothetical protein